MVNFKKSNKQRIAPQEHFRAFGMDTICLHCGWRRGQHFSGECPTVEQMKDYQRDYKIED